jgi:hypothetical protein
VRHPNFIPAALKPPFGTLSLANDHLRIGLEQANSLVLRFHRYGKSYSE